MARPRKRLLFLATEYYFFDALKKEIAPDAVVAAFDITVLTSTANSPGRPLDRRFKIVEFPWRRSNSLARAALQFLPELYRLRHLIYALKPDILHNLAMKPSVLGSLAARGRPVKTVNSLTGLGFLFYAASAPARAAQTACAWVLRQAVRWNDAQIVVLNTTDRDLVQGRMGIPARRVHLVRGSGIDTRHYVAQPPPPDGAPFTFLVIGRLLYMKGIQVAIAAFQILQARHRDDNLGAARLVICGAPDVDNPSSIPESVLDGWKRIPGVTFLGQVSDVRTVIATSHVVVHPALGGEGLPRVLQEGAASERPLIATAVAGNRDVVVQDETGLLVPPNDAGALADAMDRAMVSPADCKRWAANARAKIEREFATEHVAESYLSVYRQFAPEIL